ncbi:unnamed protein product [Pedinophyceae sp. YPF-701]|nr:unnamed protein product [Pedinophyceae sp. YPF-701]
MRPLHPTIGASPGVPTDQDECKPVIVDDINDRRAGTALTSGQRSPQHGSGPSPTAPAGGRRRNWKRKLNEASGGRKGRIPSRCCPTCGARNFISEVECTNCKHVIVNSPRRRIRIVGSDQHSSMDLRSGRRMPGRLSTAGARHGPNEQDERKPRKTKDEEKPIGVEAAAPAQKSKQHCKPCPECGASNPNPQLNCIECNYVFLKSRRRHVAVPPEATIQAALRRMMNAPLRKQVHGPPYPITQNTRQVAKPIFVARALMRAALQVHDRASFSLSDACRVIASQPGDADAHVSSDQAEVKRFLVAHEATVRELFGKHADDAVRECALVQALETLASMRARADRQ